MKHGILLLCAALALNIGMLRAEDSRNTKPDNSGINEGLNRRGSTAEEQGSSDADRQLAAKVRQSLVKDDQLSQYGKNVKIIAREGRVTLRGPVRSEQEKAAIAKKAQEIAGAHQVDNQLDIAPSGKAEGSPAPQSNKHHQPNR